MADFDEVISSRMKEAVDAIVADMPAARRPSRILHLAAGESVAWDECRAGQLSARVSALTPHRSASARPATFNPCTVDYWSVTVEILLLRCAPTIASNASFPPAATLTKSGNEVLGDVGSILATLVTLDFVDDVPTWTPRGPAGGCVGTMWTFTMKVDSPPC